VVVCLERGADLHIAQLMPLPPTVSCFSKIQIGFTFLVAAHLGSPGQRAVKRVCVCVCVCVCHHCDRYERPILVFTCAQKLTAIASHGNKNNYQLWQMDPRDVRPHIVL